MKNMPLVAIIIVVWVYAHWLISPVNVSNDFIIADYQINDVYYKFLPTIWSLESGAGFGSYVLHQATYFSQRHVLSLLTSSIADVYIRHKINYFIPILVIYIASAIYTSKKLFTSRIAQNIFIILYLTNPYIVMLSAGGQMDLLFAYALIPFLYVRFSHLLEIMKRSNLEKNEYLYHSVGVILLLLLLASFDLRACIVMIPLWVAMGGEAVITAQNRKSVLIKSMFFIVAGTVLFVLTNLHWIAPSLLSERISLPAGYESADALEFFSFARLAHAISWMHPNYPENLFGKVNEVSGLLFLFPLLAFHQIKRRDSRTSVLTGIALIAIFLAKSVNGPFGEINKQLFLHLPGMSLFRDATKFYILLNFCYAILCAISIQDIIKSRASKAGKVTIVTIICALLLINWWPTFSRNIGGTLAVMKVPEEYNQLNSELKNDKTFSRVLWVPMREGYGYYDLNHIPTNLNELRTSPTCLKVFCIPETKKEISKPTETFSTQDRKAEIEYMLSFLNSSTSQEDLKNIGIGYIVVGADYHKTMFLDNYKFDSSIQNIYTQILDKSTFLVNDTTYKEIAVYKAIKPHGLFSKRDGGTLAYTMQSPTEYTIDLQSSSPFDIYFSQRYDIRWSLAINNKTIKPIEDQYGLMKFSINASEKGIARVVFEDQKYATIGWTISQVVWCTLIALVFYIHGKKIWKKRKEISEEKLNQK